MTKNQSKDLTTVPIKHGKLEMSVTAGWTWGFGNDSAPAVVISCNGTELATFGGSTLSNLKDATGSNGAVAKYEKETSMSAGPITFGTYYFSLSYEYTNNNGARINVKTKDGEKTVTNSIDASGSITNLDTVKFGPDLYLENGYIKFKGSGDLTVVVNGSSVTNGTITRTLPNGTSTASETITGQKDITITPDNYYYKPSGNNYEITLRITNIESISDPTVGNKLRIFSVSNSTAPSISANNNTVIANASLESKTKSICTKLKNAKARVYVIKYLSCLELEVNEKLVEIILYFPVCI